MIRRAVGFEDYGRAAQAARFLSLKFAGAEAEAAGAGLPFARRSTLGGSSGGQAYASAPHQAGSPGCISRSARRGDLVVRSCPRRTRGGVQRQRKPRPYGPGQRLHLLAVIALGMVVPVRQVIVPVRRDDLPGAHGASDDFNLCHNPPPPLLRSANAMGESSHRPLSPDRAPWSIALWPHGATEMTENESLDALLKKCGTTQCPECHTAIGLENIGWTEPAASEAAGDVFPIVFIGCHRCQRRLRTIHVNRFAASRDEALQQAHEALGS